jgi:hypothetical protein
VELPEKYWSVTVWVSNAVALWFAKVPECWVNETRQSVWVGCLMEVPSNCRFVEIPKMTPYPSRADSYGKGPAAVLCQGQYIIPYCRWSSIPSAWT